MKSMRMMRVRSAGPLISKLRNKELARNKSNVSSIISCSDGSAKNDIVNEMHYLGELHSPIGDGPRILVLIGRIDMFPTWRTSAASLRDEW